MSLKCVLESWAYRFYIAQLCKIEDAKIEKSHGIGIFLIAHLLRAIALILRCLAKACQHKRAGVLR